MKFSHVLEEKDRLGPQRWSGQYICYKRLKKSLKHAKQDRSSAASASRSFLSELECELKRFNDAVLAEGVELNEARRDIDQQRRLRPDSVRELVLRERALWKRADELREFVELAYETVYKAVKKHDKLTGLSLMVPVRNRLCFFRQ